MKRIASPGSMNETGCSGLVHWDDPEGWDGEGGGRGVQDGEHMYNCGRFMSMYAMWVTWVQSLGWEDSPGGGHSNPLQYFCLENPHGQRNLVGYNPWGCKELDMTE